MKRVMFLLCVSLLFVWACKDESSNPNSYKDISLLNSASGISNTGSDHNAALALFVLDTTISFIDTAESIRSLNWSISCLKAINPIYDSISMYQAGINGAYYLAGKNIDTVVTAYVYANLPFISTALSTAEYWNTNRPSEPQSFLLISNDAFGYLGGWAISAYDEFSTNGKFDIKNQSKRINAGVGLAVVCSGGWFLGKRGII